MGFAAYDSDRGGRKRMTERADTVIVQEILGYAIKHGLKRKSCSSTMVRPAARVNVEGLRPSRNVLEWTGQGRDAANGGGALRLDWLKS